MYKRTYKASFGAGRKLLDRLAKDKRVITIQQLCDSDLQKRAKQRGAKEEVDGLADQDNGGLPTISVSEIALTPMKTLIHELGHADQFFSGQGGRLSEDYPNSLEQYIRGE